MVSSAGVTVTGAAAVVVAETVVGTTVGTVVRRFGLSGDRPPPLRPPLRPPGERLGLCGRRPLGVAAAGVTVTAFGLAVTLLAPTPPMVAVTTPPVVRRMGELRPPLLLPRPFETCEPPRPRAGDANADRHESYRSDKKGLAREVKDQLARRQKERSH